MFKEISFCTFLEYYSILIHSKFNSILPNNGQENGTKTWLLAKKKCIMEKTHLKLCFFYINNASVTQKMRFLYINGFILETCHRCMDSLIIGNVNNSKFIKKNWPDTCPVKLCLLVMRNSRKLQKLVSQQFLDVTSHNVGLPFHTNVVFVKGDAEKIESYGNHSNNIH